MMHAFVSAHFGGELQNVASEYFSSLAHQTHVKTL